MATVMATSISDTAWVNAFEEVKNLFQIEALLPEQEEGIRAFIEKGDVFVNLPTGFGKSLVYQSLPIVFDVLNGNPRGTSILLVISPLIALMEDQMKKLTDLGIPAISLASTDDPELIQQAMNGNYLLVYCSPEFVLSTMSGRGILADSDFRDKLIGVAVDEAHCITQWGLPGSKQSKAFRQWYGCLGQLHSIIPDRCKLIVLTATATKATKQQILDSLHLAADKITFVEQSPLKNNIVYSLRYMDNNNPLELQFASLINEIKGSSSEAERTLIYCQTRKQCSIIFRMFEVFLGQALYDGRRSPRNRIVEMYHAGTPSSVKEHITASMATEKGKIRVLISTVAFGMGVDCKAVRRIIHFGSPKTIEAYIQECGRAGRDGLPSTAVILHNGLTSVHCDYAMKQLLNTEGCIRRRLASHFGFPVLDECELHDCCSYCCELCECGNCKPIWSPQRESTPEPTICKGPTRNVTAQQKKTLKEELIEYQRHRLQQVKVESLVGCPNILLELNAFHFNQVIDNCCYLFTIKDIFSYIEIWRRSYAIDILKIIGQVFNDIDDAIMDDVDECLDNDGVLSDLSDWSLVRDDSTLIDMVNFDLQDFEDLNSFLNSTYSSTEGE